MNEVVVIRIVTQQTSSENTLPLVINAQESESEVCFAFSHMLQQGIIVTIISGNTECMPVEIFMDISLKKNISEGQFSRHVLN